MRHPTPALLVAVALLVLAVPSYADDWSFESYLEDHGKSDWTGFGVGTLVHRKSTQEMTMPQMPAPQVQDTEEKMTLVKVTETTYVIKVERKVMGQWQTEEKAEPKTKDWVATVEELGKETVSAAGTDYECARKKVTWKKGEEVKEEAELWVHDGKGILKMKSAKGGRGMEMVASKLEASWPVGVVTVNGRELAITMKSPMGDMTGSVSISRDVPGSLVRQEINMSQGQVKIHATTQLVTFEKK